MDEFRVRSRFVFFTFILTLVYGPRMMANDLSNPANLSGEKIKFYFNNEDISKVLENFSRVSGKKMILESSVRGKVSIFNPDTVDVDEAFNQVSKALAMNGYAFMPEGDTLVVRPVRQVQRSLIEVGTELPPLKPERMFSWVVTLKSIPISMIKNLRSLSSKDGEQNIIVENNQIIFVDWVSNLYRIRELIKQIDIPKNPNVDRLIKEYSKNSKNK